MRCSPGPLVAAMVVAAAVVYDSKWDGHQRMSTTTPSNVPADAKGRALLKGVPVYDYLQVYTDAELSAAQWNASSRMLTAATAVHIESALPAADKVDTIQIPNSGGAGYVSRVTGSTLGPATQDVGGILAPPTYVGQRLTLCVKAVEVTADHSWAILTRPVTGKSASANFLTSVRPGDHSQTVNWAAPGSIPVAPGVLHWTNCLILGNLQAGSGGECVNLVAVPRDPVQKPGWLGWMVASASPMVQAAQGSITSIYGNLPAPNQDASLDP